MQRSGWFGLSVCLFRGSIYGGADQERCAGGRTRYSLFSQRPRTLAAPILNLGRLFVCRARCMLQGYSRHGMFAQTRQISLQTGPLA